MSVSCRPSAVRTARETIRARQVVNAAGLYAEEVSRLVGGEAIGTALRARTQKLAARKQWMVDHLQMRGAVLVDAGAAQKLRGEGKSLLPIGVTEVQGDFHRGDVIAVLAPDGTELAPLAAGVTEDPEALVVAVVWEVLLEDSVLTEVLGGSDPLLLAPERLSLR